MRKNGNKSFYHYKIEYEHGGAPEFYMTLYQLMEKFECSRKTIIDKINDPLKNSRKIKGCTIIRIKEPVFIQIENPLSTDINLPELLKNAMEE